MVNKERGGGAPPLTTTANHRRPPSPTTLTPPSSRLSPSPTTLSPSPTTLTPPSNRQPPPPHKSRETAALQPPQAASHRGLHVAGLPSRPSPPNQATATIKPSLLPPLHEPPLTPHALSNYQDHRTSHSRCSLPFGPSQPPSHPLLPRDLASLQAATLPHSISLPPSASISLKCTANTSPSPLSDLPLSALISLSRSLSRSLSHIAPPDPNIRVQCVDGLSDRISFFIISFVSF